MWNTVIFTAAFWHFLHLRYPGVLPPSAQGYHWVCRAEDRCLPEFKGGGKRYPLLPAHRASSGKTFPLLVSIYNQVVILLYPCPYLPLLCCFDSLCIFLYLLATWVVSPYSAALHDHFLLRSRSTLSQRDCYCLVVLIVMFEFFLCGWPIT